MLDKIPLLIIILVVIFAMTIVLSFITVPKVVTTQSTDIREEIVEEKGASSSGQISIAIKGAPPAPQTAGSEGNVMIRIVPPS